MAVSSLLVTSLASSTVIICEKQSSRGISSCLPRKTCSSTLGFASCQALGDGILYSDSWKWVRMSKEGQSVALVRCEARNEKSNSVDIWLGRAAMLGFVAVVSIEVATGKGVLETAGLVTPLPTVALALTAVVGAVTAFGIFRSVSGDS